MIILITVWHKDGWAYSFRNRNKNLDIDEWLKNTEKATRS